MSELEDVNMVLSIKVINKLDEELLDCQNLLSFQGPVQLTPYI